jgi:chorismate mutase
MKTLLSNPAWKMLIILQRLFTKNQETKSASHQDLTQLRQQIDQLDQQIIQLLADRMTVSEAIGNVKKAQKMAFHQPNRWTEVKAHRLEIAANLGLSEAFTENLLELIHQESLQRQVK